MSETETRTKNELMEIWLRDLETTEEPQCQGTKYDGSGYCCLGRADIACFKDKFTLNAGGNYGDYWAISSTLSGERAEALGLYKELTQAEKDWHIERGMIQPEIPDNRLGSCISMNDFFFFTFPQIAAQIRAWGWDKD